MTQRRHPVERARPALRGGQHQGDAFKIEGRLSQAPAPRIQATKDAKSPMLELAKRLVIRGALREHLDRRLSEPGMKVRFERARRVRLGR